MYPKRNRSCANKTSLVLLFLSLVQRIGKRVCLWFELLRRIWKDDWHLLAASKVGEALDNTDVNKTVESSLKDLYPKCLGCFWLNFLFLSTHIDKSYVILRETSRGLLMASGFLALVRSSEHNQGSWASRGVSHSSDLRLDVNAGDTLPLSGLKK